MAKFSDIRRGGELKEALTNYVKYLDDMSTRQTKRQKGGAVDAEAVKSIKIDLIPFGIKMPTTTPKFTVRASGKGLGAGSPLRESLSGRVDLSVAETSSEVSGEDFRPAKVTVFKGSGAGKYVQSKVTKLYYIKYPGDTYSAPFGAKTEAEEYQTGIKEVRTKITENLTSAKFVRISFKPEIINS